MSNMHFEIGRQMSQAHAEITRLRTELEAERTVTLGQAADIARLAQQLAVARDGLEEITKQKLADEMDEHQAAGADFDFAYECIVKDARNTLAKLDQMQEKP